MEAERIRKEVEVRLRKKMKKKKKAKEEADCLLQIDEACQHENLIKISIYQNYSTRNVWRLNVSERRKKRDCVKR